MHEPTLTPRALLRSIIADVARKRDLDPEQIIGESHVARDVVLARVEIANRLLARGIPKVKIARMMKLHGSTVRVYLARSSRQAGRAVHHKEDVLS